MASEAVLIMRAEHERRRTDREQAHKLLVLDHLRLMLAEAELSAPSEQVAR